MLKKRELWEMCLIPLFTPVLYGPNGTPCGSGYAKLALPFATAALMGPCVEPANAKAAPSACSP